MTTQDFNDEVDVYFNINNDLFYYIDPDTDKVMVVSLSPEDASESWRSVKDFLEDIDPANPYAVLIKV